jgi:hypothetical protein
MHRPWYNTVPILKDGIENQNLYELHREQHIQVFHQSKSSGTAALSDGTIPEFAW